VIQAYIGGLFVVAVRQMFGRNQISLTSAASAEPHGRSKMNRYVVTLQIAASVALLSTAGLLARSYFNLKNMTPGFNPDPNVLLALTIPRPGQSNAAIAAYYRQLREAVVSTPGVLDVALARTVPLPMEGGGGTEEVRFPSEGNPEDKPEAVRVNMVEPNYFKIIGIPFIFGGAPSENRNEVVINATMAQQHWGSRSPVGDVIRVGSRTPRNFVITGVAADGKYGSLHEPARPYLFMPYSRDFAGESWLVVQARAVNAGLRERLQAAVQSVSSESAVLSMLTLADHHSRALYVDRLTASSLLAISIVATILAVVGLYGVLAFNIHMRQKDLAIHMALGASRDNIVLMIFKEGMWLAVLGTVIGAAGAWGLSRIVRGLLYGVEAGDPLTLGAVSVCILAVAAIASVMPARRAAAMAPASSLRLM
jgi:predicted permease